MSIPQGRRAARPRLTVFGLGSCNEIRCSKERWSAEKVCKPRTRLGRVFCAILGPVTLVTSRSCQQHDVWPTFQEPFPFPIIEAVGLAIPHHSETGARAQAKLLARARDLCCCIRVSRKFSRFRALKTSLGVRQPELGSTLLVMEASTAVLETSKGNSPHANPIGRCTTQAIQTEGGHKCPRCPQSAHLWKTQSMTKTGTKCTSEHFDRATSHRTVR